MNLVLEKAPVHILVYIDRLSIDIDDDLNIKSLILLEDFTHSRKLPILSFKTNTKLEPDIYASLPPATL